MYDYEYDDMILLHVIFWLPNFVNKITKVHRNYSDFYDDFVAANSFTDQLRSINWGLTHFKEVWMFTMRDVGVSSLFIISVWRITLNWIQLLSEVSYWRCWCAVLWCGGEERSKGEEGSCTLLLYVHYLYSQ